MYNFKIDIHFPHFQLPLPLHHRWRHYSNTNWHCWCTFHFIPKKDSLNTGLNYLNQQLLILLFPISFARDVVPIGKKSKHCDNVNCPMKVLRKYRYIYDDYCKEKLLQFVKTREEIKINKQINRHEKSPVFFNNSDEFIKMMIQNVTMLWKKKTHTNRSKSLLVRRQNIRNVDHAKQSVNVRIGLVELSIPVCSS